MRRFHLVRDEDVSGISGVGVVAEGVEFTDGRVVLAWLVTPGSMGYYRSLEQLTDIHGHGGATHVEFLD